MRKYLLPMLIGLLAIALIAPPLFAGGIKLSGVSFSLGSLKADGYVSGLGTQDVNVILSASGSPQVICQNHGGNQAPGQNPPKVSASGSDFLPGNSTLRKNGKAPFADEAMWNNNQTLVDSVHASQWGCQNDNWTAYVGPFVFWDKANITVTDTSTPPTILNTQDYSCVTTAATSTASASVSCTPVP